MPHYWPIHQKQPWGNSSPGSTEWNVINNFKTLNFFTRYTYGINYYPTAKATVDEPGYCAIDENEPGDIRNTTAVHFYRHLIFIRKGFNPEENPYKNIVKKKLFTNNKF